MKKLMATAFAVTTMASTSAMALPILIDDFNDIQAVTDVDDAPGAQTPTSSAMALVANAGVATSRSISVLTDGGGDVTGETKACTDSPLTPGGPPAGTNCLAFSADSGVTGEMTVGWTLGGGGVDLTDGGSEDALQVMMNFSDFQTILTVSVTSGATVSTHSVNTPGGIPGYPGTPFLLNYADFTDSGVFTSVDSIQFHFDGVIAATDIEVDFLGTTDTDVPAPAPFALLMLGAGLMGFVRRFRRD